MDGQEAVVVGVEELEIWYKFVPRSPPDKPDKTFWQVGDDGQSPELPECVS